MSSSGKAPIRDNPNNSNSSTQQSFTTRIAASASGLASQFFSSSAATSLSSSSAPHAVNNEEKGESSSSAAGPSEYSEGLQQRQPSASHVLDSSSHYASESFRSTPNDGTLAQGDIDAFLNYLPEPLLPQSPEPWRDIPAPSSDQHTLSDHTTGPSTPTYTDGAAVVALLDSPSFSISDLNTIPAITEEQEGETIPPSDDLFTRGLAQPDLEAFSHLKSKHLPPPPTHQGPTPDNPLNLQPDFSRPEPLTSPSSQPPTSDRLATLATQWLSVLNAYTDEVWGNAELTAPLLSEIREEIKQNETEQSIPSTNNSTSASDGRGPTLRRLEMLLSHIDSGKGGAMGDVKRELGKLAGRR
ncbi:MAG: hypothetical protein M1834_002271 [Cirrosporium novae-zelandiae]|nr:MAG: hypothetical protein M1834_002271 [Cirrosporium novae-zelandiae]